MFGHTEVVQELLKHPINKAGAMYGHESALYFASLLSNVEIVDALLKKFGVPDTYLEELNPLGGAVVNNQHGVIQRLLQEPDIKKSRILPYALSKGSDNETINLLLANPEIGLNSLYMSKGALHIAAERGDIGLVSTLLARGKQITPINHENNLVWMPFEHIIKPIYQANTIYLSDSGEYKVFNIHGEVCTGTIDMASFDLSGLRPFNYSLLSDLGADPEKALNGHVYLAKDGEYIMRDHNGMLHSGKIPDAFLSFLNMNELDVDINKPEFQFKVTFALTQVGHTQINTILKNPQLKSHLFSQLHSTGSLISFIDVNLEGPQRDKPINLAAQYGHLDIVRELLLQPDIDLNYRRGLSKPTLLTQIVRSKSPDAIRTLELLLNHPEIDVNLKDDVMSTPLCTAVQYGNVDAVRALLKHNKINVNQGNPLEIAIREGHYDILKLLINHPGINMEQPSSDGFLPLALAAHFATYNTRYDKYVRAMLSQQSVLSPTSIQQFNQLDTFWQNYYQAQPLIQCIQKNISLLNATHNGYTKLVISDKSPEEHEIDNNTIVLINDQNEWIIYRKNKDQMESLILDKSGLDIDMIRCVDNKQCHQIYKSHELIDYILLQCSHTYADVVECLQGELWDFISDCKHLEFDKEEITSQINGLCNRAMHRCNSDKNSKKPMFFNANPSTPNLNDSFSKAREECHNRIEQVHCSMQPASLMNSRMG
ncbi:ankyrin repeat domain-containing protein, partial [uncultured Legionella sp.]|uniref:ankyrin repeat domain-containing protein n=1 Tax=uncultured Legionella sp. TaxID=210934 RepID=UPI00260F439C